MPGQVLSDAVPPFFVCPISLELMQDPVSLCTGVTYDRANIQKWFDDGNGTCPATMLVLQTRELTPNHTLARLIQNWCQANGFECVERIPKPKPSAAEPEKVRLMLESMNSGKDRLATIKSLKALANSTERNKMCIKAAGAMPILANLLDTEITDSDRESHEFLQEVLDVLRLFSLDGNTKNALMRGKKHLTTICWLLYHGAIEARVNAALLLENLAAHRSAIVNIGAADGAIEGLIGLLKEKRYPTAIDGSLRTLLALCQPLKNRVKIVQRGAIPTIVELLPDADRSRTERVMALLDALCACAEGRAAMSAHALVIPSLVRSILVLQPADRTTEHALGALWSVCLHSNQEETLREAMQLGAMRKATVLLQMDCSPRTKQRAKELLRLFSGIDMGGDTSGWREVR